MALHDLTSPGAAEPRPLIDPQGRRLDYLRLSVTDRCNLRCRYCMPESGAPLAPRSEILDLEELRRLAGVFTSLGVRRIRLTGGEPLARRGLPSLARWLGQLPGPPELLLTTNGLLLGEHLDELQAAGLRRVNLSLDSLQRANWERITRRTGFDRVLRAMHSVIARGLDLKINMVVLPGLNDHEMPDFVHLTRDLALTVRFIEPMPFTGDGRPLDAVISGAGILDRLQQDHQLTPVEQPVGAVGDLYEIAGHAGRVGIIAGHSRTFCGACSRLRLDARGRLRTCLYGAVAADLGALMRGGVDDADLAAAVLRAVARRHPDGVAAEKRNPARRLDSMAGIGG